MTVAPTLIVLSTMGWLLQPYLGTPEAPDIPKVTTLEVAESLLSPALGPLPARNPFQLADEIAEQGPPARSPASSAAKGQGTPISSTTKGGITPAAKPPEGLLHRLRRLAESVRRRVEEARQAEAALRTKVEGKVKLSATSIQGNRRIAILNGRIYAEGEAVDLATGSAGSIHLAEVRPASVMLRSAGARVEVSFPPASMATGPPPTVAATPRAPKRSTNARKTVGVGTSRPR
jgi:hypothetical protein